MYELTAHCVRLPCLAEGYGNADQCYSCIPKMDTMCFTLLSRFKLIKLKLLYTVSRKKRGHVIFNYNSRISWSIFIIFVPLETGINTLQLYVIYLLKCLMMS